MIRQSATAAGSPDVCHWLGQCRQGCVNENITDERHGHRKSKTLAKPVAHNSGWHLTRQHAAAGFQEVFGEFQHRSVDAVFRHVANGLGDVVLDAAE